MTRSDISPHSPKIMRKAFRLQAASKGLSFKEAILANKAKAKDEEEGKKFEKPVGGMQRRNPGRMDGVQWNGDSFLCTRQIDGDEPVTTSVSFAVWESGVGDEPPSEEKRSYNEPMVVSLMDIARPAKRRGKKNKALQRILDNRSERSEDWEGSDVWEMHSEHWEEQSELWEIPEGDYAPDEWEELSSELYDDGETERRDSR